jgi:hypothetical protein
MGIRWHTMPRHKPQFRLTHLAVLVAVVAFELAAVRFPLSWIIVGLSLISALLASSLGPLTKIEWFGVVSIHILVWGLLGPLVESLHRSR